MCPYSHIPTHSYAYISTNPHTYPYFHMSKHPHIHILTQPLTYLHPHTTHPHIHTFIFTMSTHPSTCISIPTLLHTHTSITEHPNHISTYLHIFIQPHTHTATCPIVHLHTLTHKQTYNTSFFNVSRGVGSVMHQSFKNFGGGEASYLWPLGLFPGVCVYV